MEEETRGRKLKYGEETKRTMFRVPSSKLKEFRKEVNLILKRYTTKTPNQAT